MIVDGFEVQPLPPPGFPAGELPLRVSKLEALPKGIALPQDGMSFSPGLPESLNRPQFPSARTSHIPVSPRPWPRELLDFSRGSALSQLNQKSSNHSTAVLLPASVAWACGPWLEQAPRGTEGALPTVDGWRLPVNPSSIPLRPRDIFNIPIGTEDLGELRIVASCYGRIRALRLLWPEEFQDPAFAAQKAVLLDICSRLPQDVRLEIVAEGLAALALPGLLLQWGVPCPERINIHPLQIHATPEQVYLPMTMWARDSALLLNTLEEEPVLLLPCSFRGDCQVDPRLNRHVVQGSGAAPALLQQFLPGLSVRRSTLNFEGGDVIASRTAVLLSGSVVAANMKELKLSKDQVLQQFTDLLGLPIIVIDPPPEFHLDLGFTFLDDNLVAVADPAEGIRLARHRPELSALIQVTLEKQVVEKYERAAQKLVQLGYQVVRLPHLCGLGLTTPYFTYNNVLLENFAQYKRVYMPVYEVSDMDEAARSVYRSCGFQVVDIPSARLSTRLWGALRCATGDLHITSQ